MRVEYEIYDEVEDDETEETKTVRLALEQEGDTVHVVAVDEDGEISLYGHLIVFLPDGSVVRPQGVGAGLGLLLDEYGQIADGSL